jgi:hypothetical protein
MPAEGSPSRPAIEPARLAAANINPVTGLATDYLNHFNEAVMVLEMLPQMPECMEELIVWRPMTYAEHFAASNFKDRELAVAAYELAEPSARLRLDELAETMNTILLATRDAMRSSLATPVANALAEYAAAQLKPLVARAGAVINGKEAGHSQDGVAEPAQVAIDALMDP